MRAVLSAGGWLVLFVAAAAFLIYMLALPIRPAPAQFEAPSAAEWPKPPGDWIEFAPGTDEQTYFQDRYYWAGEAYAPPDERPGAQPNKGFDIEHDEVAKWMKGLIRPDNPPNSCCGKGDAYEVEILKDGGDDAEWVAKITHGEARKYPDNTTRPPLPNGTLFHVQPQRVVKLNKGNPTKTAWLFTYVGLRTVTVYCLVPLPPSW
jgi:hypothetical protein